MSVYGYDSGSSRRRRGPLGKLWSIITWPFRAIEGVEARVVEWGEQRRRSFRHKYRHSRVIAPLVGTLVWGVVLPFRLLWQLITAPFRMFGTASRTMSARQSRVWLHLLQGLPAVVAASGAFVVLMMLTTQAEDLPHEYLVHAQNAFSNGNYEQAEVYLHRALQLNPDSRPASYLLALTLEQNGERSRARAILDSLAPDGRRGDPRAHFRKAQYLFGEFMARREDDDPLNDATRDEISTLLQHVEYAEGISGSGRAAEADLDYFRGMALLSLRRADEAIQYLEKAAEVREELHYDLAIIYEGLLKPGAAQSKRREAQAYYETRLKADREDIESRVRLAAVISRNQNPVAAVRLLEEGLQLRPEEEQLQRALAIALVDRYTSLPAGTPPETQIALLERALRVDPACGAAIDQLLRIGSGLNRETVKDVLLDLIADGASAPMAHFALGVMAWEDESSESALWHLERAYTLDPELSKVGNNLAWVLAHDVEPPQPQKALAVINSVLESRPDHLGHVETRGQIYVKLGRWEEALNDLERALPAYRDNVELHEALGTVYENLNQPQLASKHRANAQKLREMNRGTP